MKTTTAIAKLERLGFKQTLKDSGEFRERLEYTLNDKVIRFANDLEFGEIERIRVMSKNDNPIIDHFKTKNYPTLAKAIAA